MQESGILFVIILFSVLITIINPVFVTERNLANVLRATGFTLITLQMGNLFSISTMSDINGSKDGQNPQYFQQK